MPRIPFEPPPGMNTQTEQSLIFIQSTARRTKRWGATLLALIILTGAETHSFATDWFSASSFWRTKSIGEAAAADQGDAVRIYQQFQYFTDETAGVQAVGLPRGTYERTYCPEHVPVWTASSTQTTITVTGGYLSAWNPVPWPANAVPNAGDPDHHCVIWQPSTNKMWEFWKATVVSTSPLTVTANWGGYMTNVSTSTGIFPSTEGATATGLPLVGGMITLEEAAAIKAAPSSTANLIPHVLAIALSEIADFHVAPANRHDAAPVGGDYAIPEGRRFRLPANVALPASPPLLRAIVIAARDYGLVVRDGTGYHNPIGMYRERIKAGTSDPADAWSSIMGGQATYAILNAFPWSQLEALEAWGYEPNTVIVDNSNSNNSGGSLSSKTGTWTGSASAPNYYGTNYEHDGNTGKGTKTFTFTPNLPLNGPYQVYARWTAGTGRATNTPMDIYYNGGIDSVQVNQVNDDGVWVLLGGPYSFNAGTGHKLVIGTTGTDGTVIADAVKFKRVTQVIVDNNNANNTGGSLSSKTGTWTVSTSDPAYYGTNYEHDGNTGKGTKTFTFTPNIPIYGTYQVYMRWLASTNRATNVPVSIYHTGGTASVQVNQQANNGVWILLGSYSFNAGTTHKVVISNTGTNGYVVADAVQFVK